MKKQLLLAAIIIFTCFSQGANAQGKVSANITMQPIWGPVGYDHADYYYIPDMDTYFDIQNHMFAYRENRGWAINATLPAHLRGFDLFQVYKVVINEPTPWTNDATSKQYFQYRGRHDQLAIRDSHENKYRENPNHPEHNKWHH